MDNVTHTLTGVALSQAGFNRKTRYATLALILASNLPDVDIVTRVRGPLSYLQYHRGITHSILGAVVLGALLAGVTIALGNRARPVKSKPPVRGWWLLAACWAGIGVHVLMDFTNAYGIRPFLPFQGRWYAWDIVPIVDPVLLALLIAGLGLPAVLRLVTEEVGARKTGFRRGAIFALASVAVLWGLRDVSHRRAESLVMANTYGQEAPLDAGVFPTASPFDWTAVVETDSEFHVLEANSLANDADAEHSETFHKPPPSPALDAALKTRTGRVFGSFARFLWAQVEETTSGYVVAMRDLRFAPMSPVARNFSATITLDRKLNVRSQRFRFFGSSEIDTVQPPSTGQ